MIKKVSIILFLLVICSSLLTQINVLSSTLNQFNISSNSMSQLSLSNTGGVSTVQVESFISNSTGEKLVQFVSQPLNIKSGVIVLGSHNVKAKSIVYSNSPQGNYVKKMAKLLNSKKNNIHHF